MIIDKLVVGPLAVNCYILADEQTREGVVVDAGGEPERIARRVHELGVQVGQLICTHGHVDHVGAVEPLKRLLGVKFWIHQQDERYLAHTAETGRQFGMVNLENPTVDVYLQDGDTVVFGNQSLLVVETPGHTPGGIVLLGDGDAFVGDLVFAGSIGRTDLSGGDYGAMMASLEEKLLALPDHIRLHPGHGESTTVAIERRYNPFLRGLAVRR